MPAVTVFIASINTRASTDLTLRALNRHTNRADIFVVVGDCGSTDGSLPMILGHLKAGLVDDVQLAPKGRRHAAWLDHWTETCDTRYAVFLDSDLEIRAPGWLEDMLDTISESSFVSASIYPEDLTYVDSRDGARREMGVRPSVDFMLIDVAKVRALDTSFEEIYFYGPQYAGGVRCLDVGGAILDAATRSFSGWTSMPLAFQRKYRHWIGVSWQAKIPAYRAYQLRNGIKLRTRLWAFRLPDSLSRLVLARLTRNQPS